MQFKDKVVIVTGGGQGIGRAIVQYFAAEGAQIVIADIDSEAGQECLRSIGGQGIFVATDVAKAEAVKAMVAEAIQQFGRIDMLINNAGVFQHEDSFYEADWQTWDRLIAVNLSGAYYSAKAVAPHMRDQGGGAIINIASTRAFMSEANTEPYSAAKGGLIALTHALAISLGADNIRVNSISPGWIEVSNWQKASQYKQPLLTEADHRQHPVGRVGTPEDVAAACGFLVSEAAGFITGTNLTVDGGMTVKMIYI